MAQVSLIDDWLHPAAAPAVPGVVYVLDYLTEADERALAAEIDGQRWDTDWRRRVQVYGVGYGDGATATVAPMPPLIAALGARVHADGHLDAAPDNAVVNEYVPGIGIGPHRDYRAFGPTIVGISLLSWCVMDLVAPDGVRIALPLAPRSLYVIGGEARSRWKHGIAARKNDVIDGLRVPRARRLSVTFRTALPARDQVPAARPS